VKLDISVDAELIPWDKWAHYETGTYTKEFGIDMAAMIMTSIRSDTRTICWLKRTSLLYLVRPLLIRFCLTVFRKYQFSAASAMR
jgi:hypothetical protein